MMGMRPDLKGKRILVFFETNGYYHESIPAGVSAIQALGKIHGFLVDTSGDSHLFTAEKLSVYDAIVFLNTTKDVLNEEEQTVFQQFMRSGKGFVGVHGATDTEFEWPWFNQLVGAYFKNHPKQQDAVLHISKPDHPTTRHLPKVWKRWDEWYNFKDIQPYINVLITIDETSYAGGENGEKHPISWYHTFEGARVFYTAMGHTKESYEDLLFLQHLLEGIRYAAGK